MAEHRGTPLTLLERWRAAEPVRLALYPVLVALVGVGVATGVMQEAIEPALRALFVAILGLAGTEVARGGVYAPKTVAELDADAYAEGVRDAMGRTPDGIARERGGAIE